MTLREVIERAVWESNDITGFKNLGHAGLTSDILQAIEGWEPSDEARRAAEQFIDGPRDYSQSLEAIKAALKAACKE